MTFEKTDYIRVGSYTKKLNEYPALQAQLWDRLRNSKFEERYAKQDLELENALRLLDYQTYFDDTDIPQPSDIYGVEHYMVEEEVLVKQPAKDLSSIKMQKGLNKDNVGEGAINQAYQDRPSEILRKLWLCRR